MTRRKSAGGGSGGLIRTATSDAQRKNARSVQSEDARCKNATKLSSRPLKGCDERTVLLCCPWQKTSPILFALFCFQLSRYRCYHCLRRFSAPHSLLVQSLPLLSMTLLHFGTSSRSLAKGKPNIKINRARLHRYKTTIQ